MDNKYSSYKNKSRSEYFSAFFEYVRKAGNCLRLVYRAVKLPYQIRKLEKEVSKLEKKIWK